MPMVPEAAYAMLACARIGAIHSVVFAGFSAEALRYLLYISSFWRKSVTFKPLYSLSREIGAEFKTLKPKFSSRPNRFDRLFL